MGIRPKNREGSHQPCDWNEILSSGFSSFKKRTKKTKKSYFSFRIEKKTKRLHEVVRGKSEKFRREIQQFRKTRKVIRRQKSSSRTSKSTTTRKITSITTSLNQSKIIKALLASY